MTRDDVMKMQAGREMDALMWKLIHDKPLTTLDCRRVDGDVQPRGGYPIGHISPRYYSSNIAAAWEVVEKLQAEPTEYAFEISMTPAIPHKGKPCWHVELGARHAHAPTASLAICRAALIAVMEREG